MALRCNSVAAATSSGCREESSSSGYWSSPSPASTCSIAPSIAGKAISSCTARSRFREQDMTNISISQSLRALPAGDRALLKALAACALAALALGIVFGLVTALVRTGYADAELVTGYRMLTGHGVTIFFYWLYFAQTALLLVLAAAQGHGKNRIALPSVAWAGLLLMVLGFAASQAGTWTGSPLLYDGSPDLAGENEWQGGGFYGRENLSPGGALY